MKAYTFIIFGLLLFCLGCEKNPFDYRTKYLGDYSFTVHRESWQYVPGGTSTTKDTTYAFDGKIECGEKKHTLLIPIDSNRIREIEIEKSGEFVSSISGRFESKNKVKMSYGASSLGSSTSSSVVGEKK